MTTLVKIMAWRRRGDKPLSLPMMVCLLTHICATRPQWVRYVNFHTLVRWPFILSGKWNICCMMGSEEHFPWIKQITAEMLLAYFSFFFFDRHFTHLGLCGMYLLAVFIRKLAIQNLAADLTSRTQYVGDWTSFDTTNTKIWNASITSEEYFIGSLMI